MGLDRCVIFVGDKPSKENIRQDIPFVGTKSYKTLLDWIYVLDVDISNTLMFNINGPNRQSSLEEIKTVSELSSTFGYKDTKVIALGLEAHKTLMKNGIAHHTLPHPSGLNRKLNDKKGLKHILTECKLWLHS